MNKLREDPLHIAAQAGDAQKVARLIAEGAVVDAGNIHMYTPLHIAAGMAASEVVAMLLDAGADVGALTVFQDTPLHRVAHGLVGAADARLEIIDRLLDAGCPLNAVDTAGRTALWYAAGTGTTPWTPEQQTTRFRVLQHLLDRGADPSIAARGKQGRPIDAARGLHQLKKYRIEWAEGAALLEQHGQ
ncbi:ankyrin repeat domain-containing protein [Dactylosporangium sp. CA-139114]|uniref:ankyrin repeat domain-containing protein n=1 Tax=Dactylosporangium sp. CA-139114 TaxID=3239931 RepID=UPI003D96130F